MGSTADFINCFTKVLDNQDGISGCPLCQTCHDYLTPEQFSECLNDGNLCLKSDMVKIKMLDEILDRLAALEKNL